MKKVDVLQLIASICMFVACIINLLENFLEIPFVLRAATLPLLMISVVLYSIVLAQKTKSKKRQQKDESN